MVDNSEDARFNHASDITPAESDDIGEVEMMVACWRCQQDYAADAAACPLCAASNRHRCDEFASVPATAAQPKSPAVVRVVWAFSIMAAVSIAFGIFGALSPIPGKPGTLVWGQSFFARVGFIEVVDTLIVVMAFCMIPVSPQWQQPTPTGKLFAWGASIPLMAITLALNFGYHHWLADNWGIESLEEKSFGGFPQLWPWILLTICLQPGIVEELFFRHIALGAAMEVTPPKQAVFISSLLFAFAHLGNPLSIPTLIMLGVVLGALRLASGSLLLPIVFHFLHNLLVVCLEAFS
ncbi:MAG: CPBP family intramembrane glutamic endopeptidase [Planctomycetaceae bacterium]